MWLWARDQIAPSGNADVDKRVREARAPIDMAYARGGDIQAVDGAVWQVIHIYGPEKWNRLTAGVSGMQFQGMGVNPHALGAPYDADKCYAPAVDPTLPGWAAKQYQWTYVAPDPGMSYAQGILAVASFVVGGLAAYNTGVLPGVAGGSGVSESSLLALSDGSWYGSGFSDLGNVSEIASLPSTQEISQVKNATDTVNASTTALDYLKDAGTVIKTAGGLVGSAATLASAVGGKKSSTGKSYPGVPGFSQASIGGSSNGQAQFSQPFMQSPYFMPLAALGLILFLKG